MTESQSAALSADRLTGLAGQRRSAFGRLVWSLQITGAASLFSVVAIFAAAPFPDLRIVPQVALLAILLAYVAFLWRIGEAPPRTPLDYPALALVIVVTLSTVWGLNPRLSLEWLPYLFGLIALYYVFVDTIRRGWFESVYLPTLLVLSAILAVVSVLELAGWYLGWGLFGPLEGWLQASGGLTWPPVHYRIRLPLDNSSALAVLKIILLPFVALA